MVISLGCTKEVDQESTELFSVFRSNTGLSKAEEFIKSIGLNWNIEEELEIPEKDGAQAVKVMRVKVEEYNDAGVSGILLLSFFDGRIVSALFEPDDWEKYKPVLKYTFGKEPEIGDEIRLPIRTVVAIQKNHRNKMFVSWTDEALSNYALEQSYTP